MERQVLALFRSRFTRTAHYTTLVARRTASAASISSWQFKLGWLDSSNTVAVVSHKAEYDAGDVGEPC